MKSSITALAIAISLAATPALAGPAQDTIVTHFQKMAGNSGSSERGKTLFKGNFSGGKPDTPSCTTCHSRSPANAGKTRAGKTIEPMALSRTPERYSDLKKVEKWFRRNCKSVLGRVCSAQEKTDFLAFMIKQ